MYGFMFSQFYLEIRICSEVLEVNLDPEGRVRSGAVCIVELRHPRDVQVEHVLLDLKIHVDFMTNNNNVMSVSLHTCSARL